ncbi:hypothetical protein NPIL_125501 [Nephila pilipes]|uniref:Uncharacterized protein n=1 Tax=Nephila pilipes TaxID=299642 RepID=A0A8X6MV66_NEPPI|nr:hypothetical protein NPIL_125501 [Nephila pilipes]
MSTEETPTANIVEKDDEISLSLDLTGTKTNASVSESGDYFASKDIQNSNLRRSSKETEGNVLSATKPSQNDRKTLQILHNVLTDFRLNIKKGKRYRSRGRPNVPYRQSGRRWTPISIWKPDRTPPRRRPDSSTSSSSSERPEIRGRSPVRRPTKKSFRHS